MEGLDIFGGTQWQPLAYFGYTNPLFNLNAQILIYTWIAIAFIVATIIVVRFFFNRNKVLRYLVTSFVGSFVDITYQTLGSFSFNHFCFITSLFIFLLVCNTLALIPFLDEPTKNLNTTLSLGIIAFLYVQIYAIKAHGLWGYIKEYFSPFFVMFPLHVVGKLATIVSMSFRLFGNIFGGSTISHITMTAFKKSVFLEIFGIISGLNILIALFFGLFEGLIQAFVFTMITLTYLSIALQGEEEEESTTKDQL